MGDDLMVAAANRELDQALAYGRAMDGLCDELKRVVAMRDVELAAAQARITELEATVALYASALERGGYQLHAFVGDQTFDGSCGLCGDVEDDHVAPPVQEGTDG